MSLSGLTPAQLAAKYGLGRAPRPDGNRIVDAMYDIGRTIDRITRRPGCNSWLFDPVSNPAMRQLADQVMRDVRSRFGLRIAKAPDGASFLYYPGKPKQLRVYRDGIERFSDVLGIAWHEGCDIRLATGGCTEGTKFLPLQRGQFLVVFEICERCDEWAGQTAQANHLVSEMEARIRVGLLPL